MHRIAILGWGFVMAGLIGLLTLVGGGAARLQQADFSKVQNKVNKVSGNITMVEVTVHLNGEDIRALHFPSGHTDGDSIIFFPKNNVVHMGDDFVRYGFPFIDVASGGSVQGMISALE